MSLIQTHVIGHCSCYACAHGLKAYKKKVNESLKRYGWYGEYVQYDTAYPNNINFHTHGLEKKWKHPDLQICLPTSAQTAHMIFTNCIDRIKAGEVFNEEGIYKDILGNNYDLMFRRRQESGREVLRLIMPNAANLFTGLIYERQFDQ